MSGANDVVSIQVEIPPEGVAVLAELWGPDYPAVMETYLNDRITDALLELMPEEASPCQ